VIEMNGGSASLVASPRPWLSLLRPPPHRWQVAIAWLLAITAIGYLAVIAVSGLMPVLDIYRPGGGLMFDLDVDHVTGLMLDLNVYRAGGQAILHGSNLYAIRAADKLPFTYPPVSAVLAVPLALVPFQVARVAWTAMVYLPLLFAVRIGFRPILDRAGGGNSVIFPGILAVAAYLLPIRQVIGFGQVDMLLLGLCLLDCVAASPKWPRGLLIGLATAIKLEPGVFIIYLLLTRRWRETGVAVLSFAGWTGLAWLINPRDSVAYWTGAIFDTSRLGGNASAGNQSLRGMVLRLHANVAPDLIWLPLALVVAVAGFAAARACWRQGHDLAGIAITGLLAALLSPVAWIHHLCWVLIAMGVIAGDGRSVRRSWLAALTGALFLSTFPIWAEVSLPTSALRSFPGFLLENSFGLWALVLIPVLFWIGARRAEPLPADAEPAAVAELA
jgi:alpha-1,2-mannosyltransferase